MPKERGRPATSGYARLAQAEDNEQEYQDDSEDEDVQRSYATISDTTNTRTQPSRRSQPEALAARSELSRKKSRRKSSFRPRANSGIDVKALNARLERWAEEIATKFKFKRIKGKSTDEEKLEIHHSVFQPPEGLRPASSETLALSFGNQAEQRMSKLQFDDIVESVRVAIELGLHPKMISQGSSGSYFARNSEGKVVGVFKPKDEEPYASRNPKWTKWIHRNLFPFFFGRACLIPNLSYVSEAAAYILDTRLQTNLVPYTDIVHLSSIAFNYDFWDRRAYYRNKKQLHQKVGSFQVFLKGFQDANVFLKQHPWPDQNESNVGSRPESRAGHKRKRRRWADDCRGVPDDEASETESEDAPRPTSRSQSQRRVFWTPQIQQSFREQLERLVILDYIMRNTDRGLDNWMIKIDEQTQTASIVAEPPRVENGEMVQSEGQDDPYAPRSPMTARSDWAAKAQLAPSVSLGAIDNSLSWPWKHPDAWRSFPFGWLFLPVSLIGQPFSERTRLHFLPLLTSRQWWSDTQVALRQCFSQDSDFQDRMFARQIAVMKGQAWNVVETLKTSDHGPLELTRRQRVCVWDDLVEVPTVLPLRPSSDEARRRRRADRAAVLGQPEMDISNAEIDRPTEQYPLQLQPEDARPNRFNLSRANSNTELSREGRHSMSENRQDEEAVDDDAIEELAQSSATIAGSSADYLITGRPKAGRSKTRLSFEQPRQHFDSPRTRKRNMSFSVRRLSEDFSRDDLEADLGYAAARDREGNRKKVIVERLELIKSKGPFFTWC